MGREICAARPANLMPVKGFCSRMPDDDREEKGFAG
jgi:hypothetical protein